MPDASAVKIIMLIGFLRLLKGWKNCKNSFLQKITFYD